MSDVTTIRYNDWEPIRPPVGDVWEEVPAAENRFREHLTRGDAEVLWAVLFGDERPVDEVVENLRNLVRSRRQ